LSVNFQSAENSYEVACLVHQLTWEIFLFEFRFSIAFVGSLEILLWIGILFSLIIGDPYPIGLFLFFFFNGEKLFDG
jgi:hypothetical protein